MSARHDIRNAIATLVAARKEPTTRAVRAILGRGSMSTIGSELRAWRDEQRTKASSTGERATLEEIRRELGLLREASERQLAVAYERYDAVQKRMLLEIDRAREQVRESRKATEDAQEVGRIREAILRQANEDLRRMVGWLQDELEARAPKDDGAQRFP